MAAARRCCRSRCRCRWSRWRGHRLSRLAGAAGGQWRQCGIVVVLAVGVGGHAGVVIVSAVWQEPRGVNGGSAALLSFSLSVSVVTLELSSSRPSDRSRGRQTSTVSFVIRVSAGSDRLRRAARAAMP